LLSFKIKHEFKKKGGERDEWTIEQILHVLSWFQVCHHQKGRDCGSKASKLILMMPKTQVKNQDSSKFQESNSHSIKNQDSSEESTEDSRNARTSRKTSR